MANRVLPPTAEETAVLRHLASAGPATPTEIAREVSLSVARVIALLAGMRAARWVDLADADGNDALAAWVLLPAGAAWP